MSLPPKFIASLEFVQTRELVRLFREKTGLPQGRTSFELTNELRPLDIYCYLGGRFGAPNGIQNLIRENHSSNLIHWEWMLRQPAGFVIFQGMNFRTEIHILGAGPWEQGDRDELIAQIKSAFSATGLRMKEVRDALEKWIEFVNPYERLRRAIDRLREDLDALGLQPDMDAAQQPWDARGLVGSASWEGVASRYSKGFGLCLGIRAMLPVLAEAFVNLVLYVLMKPEMKSNDRLRESAFRQPIDVRISSLSINCDGFGRQPDFESDACKRYHTLVNNRNDLLHGNVAIEKLKFNEVWFNGTVPVFREYRSVWERSLGVEMKAVGLEDMRDELQIVEGFIQYIKDCLADDVRPQIESLVSSHELGLNSRTQRLGILFAGPLVDFRVS